MTPSAQNKQHLALGLHDAGEFEEAGRLFGELLASTPDDPRSLHGYAQCLVATGDPADRDEAIRALRHLIEDNRPL